MQKVVIHRPGGHDRLRIEQHPDLSPGPGEVLVAVEAIGINYADCVTRMGLYASAKHYVGFPITPGFEVAGRIQAVGPGVTDLPAGTEVIAVTRFNGYATSTPTPTASPPCSRVIATWPRSENSSCTVFTACCPAKADAPIACACCGTITVHRASTPSA